MRYTNNKINKQAACIALNYNTNINGIVINKYAVYGKLHDTSILFTSVNKKAKIALSKVAASTARIYWVLENKNDLLDTDKKAVAIKVIFPGEDTIRQVWIYRNSRMLKYIQAATTELINQSEFKKPVEKAVKLTSLYVNQYIDGYKKARAKWQNKNDMGLVFNHRIGNYKPERVI